LNERNNLKVDYSYMQVRYDGEPVETFYYDYNNQWLSLAHDFAWTPQTRLSTTLSLSRYQRDDVQFGLSYMFSERWSGSFMAGGRRTKNTLKTGVPVCDGYVMPGFFFGKAGSVCVDRDTLLEIPFGTTTVTNSTYSSGGVFSASLQRRHETGSLALNVSRNITPSAYYGLILTDRASFSLDESLSETLSASVSLAWYSSKDTAAQVNFLNRRYIQISPRIVWRFAREWSMTTSYRYRKQRYAQAGTAMGNAVWVILRHSWPKVAVAR